MTKFLKLHHLAIAAVAALAVVAFGTQDANAQSQTVNYTASVTVQNTFTVGETTALNLGTIAAVADPTSANTQATLVLAGNSGTSTTTNGNGTARILAITTATPGVLSVTAAPPSTLFTVTQGSTIQLVDPAVTGETTFDFTPAAVCAGFNCTTDAAGALTINVGGTLSTRAQTSGGAEDNGYSDGTYTGTYSVTLAF
ncbi:MAG: hypothetical protein VW999_06660 [Alphaproteobacteria bacterium]